MPKRAERARRPKRAHTWDWERRVCATPGCEKEVRKGSRFCSLCATIYHRKLQARKWQEATEEELMNAISKTRRWEKSRLKARREAYAKECGTNRIK